MKPPGAKQCNATRLGLLLGLVACLILAFSNSGRLPNQLHRFIENRVIRGFEGQRQRGHQFAVLLLIPESDLDNINLVSLQPQDNHQQPLVDNANCCCPNRRHYRNYVAARPHLNRKGIAVHSEVTLLHELPHLWEAFVASYGFVPSYIILYSWMMPCPHCTEQICRTLRGTRYQNTSVIIAYTINWKMFSDAENEESRDILQAAGIKVEQVKYHSRLPHVREHKADGESIAKKMTKLHLHDTLYDLTDSEEYDDEDSDEEYEDEVEEDLIDSEEYDDEDSDEEDEDEVEEDLTDSEEYDDEDSDEEYEDEVEEDLTDSEEYDDEDSDEEDEDELEEDLTDSEEYDDEDRDEEYEDEDEVEEDLTWQLQEDLVGDIHADIDPTSQLLQEADYTSEQPNNGPNGHHPEGQGGAFPDVPVRRKPPQAKVHSTQDDAKSLDMIRAAHLKYFLRLLSTDDNTLQCTDSSDSDTESGTHVPGEEPPDRYKLT